MLLCMTGPAYAQCPDNPIDDGSHSYRLETASWQAGVFIVETISPDGQRSTGKLVIQK